MFKTLVYLIGVAVLVVYSGSVDCSLSRSSVYDETSSSVTAETIGGLLGDNKFLADGRSGLTRVLFVL